MQTGVQALLTELRTLPCTPLTLTHGVPGCPWVVSCEAAPGTHLLLQGKPVGAELGSHRRPRAVSSLQQHRQSELSSDWHGQMGAAFHYPLGAGEEKVQIQSCPGSWLAPWGAGQTLRVLHSPTPNSQAQHPRREQWHRLGLQWMSFSSLCSPLMFHHPPQGEASGRVHDQ